MRVGGWESFLSGPHRRFATARVSDTPVASRTARAGVYPLQIRGKSRVRLVSDACGKRQAWQQPSTCDTWVTGLDLTQPPQVTRAAGGEADLGRVTRAGRGAVTGQDPHVNKSI